MARAGKHNGLGRDGPRANLMASGTCRSREEDDEVGKSGSDKGW